ncbi:hypothetical protein TNCT_639571 [Trichonephila clavata]|uniref:Uncharacterized protein n=1 Tax=Trichonephila clavata TaxID=2740835 RepID=A0A8X6FJ78_TRICU|nr:hypothetical protein TNCT_639571 [Trichonephila clavata]
MPVRELASSFFQNVPTHSNHTIAQAALITPGLYRHAAASMSIQTSSSPPNPGLPFLPISFFHFLISGPYQMLVTSQLLIGIFIEAHSSTHHTR